MSNCFSHETYVSPFTWRYGSPEMRQVWSEANKRRLWRRVWLALAEAEQSAGLVSATQVAELRAYQDDVNLAHAAEIEAQIHHDLMAELRCYAEQCPLGGAILHLGATSADVEDNADALRLRASLDVLLPALQRLLLALAERIEREAGRVCMGFTHLQPAEPTTVGYRLAGYAQDLLDDWHALCHVRDSVRGKGFKGAVGSSASFAQLLEGTGATPHELEARAMRALDLEAFAVAAQTYPRRQDWKVLTALSGLGLTLYRMAFDLRVLQSPPIGEWAEPFAAEQVGSSAMPFKRNPIHAENIDSLARFLAALPQVAWDNAAHHLLERTLDDSANRRVLLPEAFLTADELLCRAQRIVAGLRLDERAIRRNLDAYGTFAATERLLMACARAGGDRQALHAVIREHSLSAWEALHQGQPNPLTALLCADERITRWLSVAQVRALLLADTYVGDAPVRAKEMATRIRTELDHSQIAQMDPDSRREG